MDGEKQPQCSPPTTHGFLISLTFLFSPLSEAAIQNRARATTSIRHPGDEASSLGAAHERRVTKIPLISSGSPRHGPVARSLLSGRS